MGYADIFTKGEKETMRKIYLIFLMLGFLTYAQGQPSSDVQKLIKALGVPQRIEAMREYQRMWTNPEKEKEFMLKFEETVPVFLQNVEAYYLKNYTAEEIKEILKFYESPLGKKITSNAADLNIAYSGAEEKWDDLFNNIYYKYKDR